MLVNCIKHGLGYHIDGKCQQCFFRDLIERHRSCIADAPKTTTDPVIRQMKATDFLAQAASEMKDRASTYDKPEGERSMGACVAAFIAVTGIAMSEQQGWQFMELLKMVRSNQGTYRADSFLDGAAYASLAGEAAARLADKP